MKSVRTGLDVLRGSGFALLSGAKVGLLVHPASVASDLIHAADLFLAADGIQLVRLFGPQHGILGQTQDNMVEWASFTDPRTGVECVSLYGEHRRPTPEMLEGLDVLVVDLQDVGARYYTFNWTTLLCMEACAEAGVKVVVLDRPNPIGGAREGPILDMRYKSFVGMAPVPARHGITPGEMATFCNVRAGCELEVVRAEGWRRADWFDATGLPWVMPSPNMPALETATVYPGTCLLEGTELSEGRGTTRPFEIFGAPFVNPQQLAARLGDWSLPGVLFRPTFFEPTFQKHAGELCGGAQIHVTDRGAFRPVLTATALLCAIRELWPAEFAWKQPPYEYESEKMPIDILAGGEDFRTAVDAGRDPREIAAGWDSGVEAFGKLVAESLHYD
ncbi:MAG: exo-beta-N-acetylmuramidase NamZ family protein [Planctomycetota bacterium]